MASGQADMERRRQSLLEKVTVSGSAFTLWGDVGALVVSAVECDGPQNFASGEPSRTMCCRVRFFPTHVADEAATTPRQQPASRRTWMVSGFDGEDAPLAGYAREDITAACGPLREAQGARAVISSSGDGDGVRVSLALPGHPHGVVVSASCRPGDEFSLTWTARGAKEPVLADLQHGAYPFDSRGGFVSHYQQRCE